MRSHGKGLYWTNGVLFVSAALRRALFLVAAFLAAAVRSVNAQSPDPTLLPVATTLQTPQTAAYNALNVPGMAAGAYYLDPLTRVRVYKLTSATFPTTGFSWGHDYAEGGDEVSLPLDGSGTRAIHVYTSNGTQWLIDFTPGVGVSNPRNLSASSFRPFMNLTVSFSNNPATPHYMYVSDGATIRRVNLRTMTEAPGGGWPVTGETGAMWMHQNENDTFFTWMRGANGPTVVGYEPATGIKKTYTNSGLNEPRIDRHGSNRSIAITMTNPQNQALFWDWRNNVITWSSPVAPWGGDPPVAHHASMRGYWIGVQWNWSYPWPFFKISATPNSVVAPLPGGPAQGGGHCNGNWIQHPANPDDQWFGCYYYGALVPSANNVALAPGGILLGTANGQRRVLAHLYNTTSNYTFLSFVKFSSDGRYALFTSNMNGSSRSDLFLVEMPTSGTPPPLPPPPDITPPTVPAGLTATAVSASQINLSWTASTDTESGMGGYKIFRGGAQIGTSVSTSYPNTGLSASTTYTYTVSAYDMAGNTSVQSASASATTLALPPPPPPPPPSGGPIVLLHLDENAGSSVFNDGSGSTNHGSCVSGGCPTSGVAGKVGPALSFDGMNNLVAVTHRSSLNAFPLTVASWFKTNSATGVVGLVNKYVGGSYNGYNVFLTNGNVCAWYLKDSSNYVYDGSACPFNIAGYNDNAWHQVVYVVDASGGKLYLDGVQRGTTRAWTGVAGSPTTTQDVHLGHYPGAFGGREYYPGLLDEVRIYNSALTAGEVSALFNADNVPPADTTAPAVAISAPANGANVSATVPVGATASDNVGVVGVQFQLDGTPMGAESMAAPYSVSWDTRAATNGSHTITAVARDAAGNRTTSAPVTVTVANIIPDATPPSVAISTPVHGASVSASVTVGATASDNVGVIGVQFQLDGAPFGAESTAAPYSVSWDTRAATNGSHTITAVARDEAGNRTTSAPVTVSVANSVPDTTPPTVPAGLSTTAISSSQINLSWTASTDAESGMGGYKIFRGGAQIGTSVSTSYPNTGLSASTTYTYTVSAYDMAGNTSVQSASASATTLALPPPPPPPPPSGGPIVLLHLDENAGSSVFNDGSGSTNHGSCVSGGCPTSGVAGKVGPALSFDGMNNLVAVTHRSSLNAFPLTVASWFKTNSTTGVVGLVNKYVGGSYNGYNVFLNNGNVCAWYLKDSSNYIYNGSGCPYSIAGYNDNAWHQVVYVVDASGGKLYLDGVQRGTTRAWTGVAGSPTTTQDVHLGHYPGAFGGREYYPGLLDEVRIYNSALTAGEVSALFNADNVPPPPQPPPPQPPPPPAADTTAPASAITSPISDANVTNMVTISANASDNVAVAGVQFYVNGSPLDVQDTTAPYAVSWDTTKTANGFYTLTAVAHDAAGNSSTSAPVSVMVANSSPESAPTTTGAINWTSLVNVAASPDALQKTAGCNGCPDAGAVSVQALSSGNGYVEFAVTETTSQRAIGLSRGNTDVSVEDIDFGLVFGPEERVNVIENGVFKTVTACKTGDILRISVEAGVVKYAKNGTVFHNSTRPPKYPLLIDTSFRTMFGTLSKVRLQVMPSNRRRPTRP